MHNRDMPFIESTFEERLKPELSDFGNHVTDRPHRCQFNTNACVCMYVFICWWIYWVEPRCYVIIFEILIWIKLYLYLIFPLLDMQGTF